MNFDKEWFGELKNLQTKGQPVAYKRDFVPTLGEILEATSNPSISLVNFVNTACNLLKELHKLMPTEIFLDFRYENGVIYTYQKGKSNRKQLNIAFSAEEHARIGLAFKDTKAQEDYLNFAVKLIKKKDDFDKIVKKLGYMELDNDKYSTAQFPKTPSYVLLNHPKNWMFFGRKLILNDASDQKILSSLSEFAKTAKQTFGLFKIWKN